MQLINYLNFLDRRGYLPTHTPVPMMGGLMTQTNGGSQLPLNPPGPPQASPFTFAHILQHLKWQEFDKLTHLMKLDKFI